MHKTNCECRGLLEPLFEFADKNPILNFRLPQVRGSLTAGTGPTFDLISQSPDSWVWQLEFLPGARLLYIAAREALLQHL